MRSRSSAVLLALAIAACAASVRPSGYAPKWHVGDWWLTKTLKVPPQGGGPVWRYKRYDVVRIEKVEKRDCFVLMTRTAGLQGEVGRDTVVSYVRGDSWLVVRQEITHTYNDTMCPHWVQNTPLGRFGPDAMGSPRLPRFPLRLGEADTTFKLLKCDDGGFAELREISSIAEPASVRRSLDYGDSVSVTNLFGRVDSTRVRVVRPTGVVYQVRKEIGGNLGTDDSRIGQSRQFWSNDQPWRVYDEFVLYDGPKPVRRVGERTWLVASGHAKM